MKVVYLDNNATTPVPEPVLEAMLPYFGARYGNPSSAHVLGRGAAEAMATAREQVAALLGCRSHDLMFTSNGTEANNTALYAWLAQAPEKRHIVVTSVEHASVLNFATEQERAGYDVTRVPVDGEGRLDPEAVREALRPDTACAAIMWANNETGVVHPMEEIATVCAEAGVPLHVDAVQIVGKRPVNVRDLPMDSLAISGHKMYAPKGIGALYMRKWRRFRPLFWGGHQEHQHRAGTENVPGIVGLGAAATLIHGELDTQPARQLALRDRLERRLAEVEPGVVIHAAQMDRLPNTSSFHITNLEGEAMVRGLSEHGVCVSTGAACEAGTGQPSHVMDALGLPKAEGHGALRVSLGRSTVKADIDALCDALPAVVASLRAILPRAPAAIT